MVLSALVDLIEDDAQRYKVCACLPSFLACFIFQIYDISMVIAAVLCYYISYTLGNDGYPKMDVFVPIGALLLSFATFFSGPVGLFFSHGGLLIFYFFRLAAIVLYSFSWICYIYMKRTDLSGYLICAAWFLATVVYIWGIFVTMKAITYTIMVYRGYDDVDPATQKHFDIKLEKMMKEMRQREDDQKFSATTMRKTKTNRKTKSSNTERKKEA